MDKGAITPQGIDDDPGQQPRNTMSDKISRILRSKKLIGITIIGALLGAAGTAFLSDPQVFSFIIPEGEEGGISTSEWALQMTQITKLHSRGLEGVGLRICVVDTGVELTHPDLSGTSIIAWLDLVNGEDEPYDDDGHGTAMMGILAGNGIIKGVAPKAHYIVVKAIMASGSGESSDVVRAIEFCMDPDGDGSYSDGAHVISLSLGGGEHRFFGSEVGDAATTATNAGIFVVASAGNDGASDDGDVESPASETNVISVGSIDENGDIAIFSSVGDNDGRFSNVLYPFDNDNQKPDQKPEVVAPGVGIVTTGLNGGYVVVEGTSPSAAMVSGIIALALQAKPSYRGTGSASSITMLKEKLANSCLKMSGQDTPHDDHYGYGLVQGLALVDRL